MSFLGGSNKRGSGNKRSSGGSPTQQSKQAKKRSILDYSPTYRIIKAVDQVVKAVGKNLKKIHETNKKRAVNTSLLGSSDYQGDVEGKRSRVKIEPPRNGVSNTQSNTQSNIQITSKPGSKIQKTAVKKAPVGPTVAELEQTEEQRLLRIKRRGRKSTKLKSLDDELTLSKKTLLG